MRRCAVCRAPRRASRLCVPAFTPCVSSTGGCARVSWPGRTLAPQGQGLVVVKSGVPLISVVPCAVTCVPGSRPSCRAYVLRVGEGLCAPWHPSRVHPSADAAHRALARAHRSGAACRACVGRPRTATYDLSSPGAFMSVCKDGGTPHCCLSLKTCTPPPGACQRGHAPRTRGDDDDLWIADRIGQTSLDGLKLALRPIRAQ
jgi:hypothetical protein